MKPIHVILAFVLIVAAAMAAIGLDRRFRPAAAPPSAQFTPAPPIPAAAAVKVVKVPGPTQIVVQEKAVVVHDLKLPDEVAKDPDKQVAATAQVKEKDGEKTDAIAVIETKTGATEIETKQERPFFSFLNEKEIGIRAGVGLEGYQGDVFARWTIARVGSVHLSLYGEATAPLSPGSLTVAPGTTQVRNGKLMLEAAYRW